MVSCCPRGDLNPQLLCPRPRDDGAELLSGRRQEKDLEGDLSIFRPTRVQDFSGGLRCSRSRWVPECQSHIVGSELGSVLTSSTSFLLFMAWFSPLFSAEDGPAQTTSDSRLSDRGPNPEVGPAISLQLTRTNQNYQKLNQPKNKASNKKTKTKPTKTSKKQN